MGQADDGRAYGRSAGTWDRELVETGDGPNPSARRLRHGIADLGGAAVERDEGRVDARAHHLAGERRIGEANRVGL